MDPAAAIARARSALDGIVAQIDPREPFAAALARIAGRLARPFEPQKLFEHWQRRSTGSPVGADRYRWELTHARATGAREYAGDPSSWRAWRPSEQPFVDRDVFEYESRFTQPVVLAECIEFLAQAAADGFHEAERFLAEAEPVLRRDFAGCVQARAPTTDTLALWILTRSPHALELLAPIALAIAECYAATARAAGGRVLGLRFPFHEQALVSASAALASSLFKLGLHLDLFADLSRFVRSTRRSDAAWADASEPPDVLTTLIAADLLARTDPSFDPEPTAWYLVQRQEPAGLWRVFGPEAPWLTAAVVEWLDDVLHRPFAERFRWPHVPNANLDKKTRLPFYAHFADLAELFALEGFEGVSSQLAFIDLAGFREFNNRFGQTQGDEALAAFAATLQGLPGARAIRDGGDEFLVVGAPTAGFLERNLDALRRRWPTHFAQCFGTEIPPVAPRILVTTCRSANLLTARETLGRRISELKKRSTSPGPDGVLELLPSL